MKGFVIAVLDDDGSYKGFHDGASFTNSDLEKASFIKEKTQARGALGNLQRTTPDLDLTIVSVEMSISILPQSSNGM